ncbi:hypothetical protein BC829DRAFT_383733 [Chytridium lagenaria]|nr:hypothetical protein BC829DRAFT_383733 [Chytridium lagenaria]
MAAPSPPQYSAEFNQDAASADTSDSSRPQTGSSTTGSVATSGSSLESPYVTPFRTHPSSAERIDRRASSHIRRRDTAFAAASSRPVSRHASMLNSIPAQDADVPPSSTPPAPAPVPVVNTPQPSKVLLPVVDLDDIKTSYIPSAAWGDNFLKELDDRLYETKTTKKPVTFSMMLRGEDDSREVDSGASLFVSDVEAKDVSAEVLPLPTVNCCGGSTFNTNAHETDVYRPDRCPCGADREGEKRDGNLLRRALEPCGIWLLLEKENDLELELKEKKKNYQRTLSDIQFVRDEMQLFRNHLLQVRQTKALQKCTKGITEILVENINLVQFIASSGTSAPKMSLDATRDYATSVAASCSSSSASGSSHSSRRNSSAAQKFNDSGADFKYELITGHSLSFTSRPMGSTVSIIERPKIVGDGASGRKTRDVACADVQMARRSSFRDGAIAGSPSGSAEPLGQEGSLRWEDSRVSRGSFLTLNLESAPHEATGRRRSNTGLQGSKLSLALPGL